MDFKDLVTNNKYNVKNVIRMITKQENEDLEQEVFIRAWKNADKYKERGALKGWLNTIARNVAKDYLKSAWFKNNQNADNDDYTLNSISDNGCTPEASVISLERRKRVLEAIEGLKPKLKETIMLCEIQGLSYEEAAKKLKCPLGTVKSRIFNAKKELALKLEDLL